MAAQEKAPSFIEQARQAYDQVVCAIIRPPRTVYEVRHLGPTRFSFLGRPHCREDFVVHNARGQALECSRWRAEEPRAPMLPTLIFMHGNASARLEAIPQLSVCLALGVAVVSFDFSGSGLSDGEYVTLGANERNDCRAVVTYLRAEGKTSTIAFWGRSMGAVTALLYADEDNMIDAMVLDSPFASLRLLAEELVERATASSSTKIPKFAVAGALRLVRSSIRKRAGIDIDDIAAIDHCESMYVPALFCVVHGDSFISNTHSEKLHGAYAGDKFILAVEGDHNDTRPPSMHVFASRFLSRYMQVPASWALPARDSVFTSSPPWSAPHGEPLARKRRDVSDFLVPQKPPPRAEDPEDLDLFAPAPAGGEQSVGMTRARARKVEADVANLF
eukprot:CAMPEP_0119277992 /NCGR_PEP_ID=MMETSP1329-20130426/18266_1 /TAXON_ID=114041 /ORGANISM="Genus nov. species nov., Strain RCC1024" /LENGTH=388 /DNA_ID=CAMNT_0007278489 /DNA_START=203 /DNA_END=1366 /DNA_ORIENTATION=-